MKKYTIPVLIFISFFSLHACKKVEKDPLDYYPKVKTVSAVITADGQAEITGEIIDAGVDDIVYAGFCMNTAPHPEMTLNQEIVAVNGNTFKFTYEDLNFPDEYFFQAWVANEYGYARGDIISLDSIKTIIVTPPCNVGLNTVTTDIGSPQSIFEVSYQVLPDNKWRAKAFAGNNVYYFVFNSAPVTGIYSTTDSPTLGPNQLYIYFDIGWTSSGTVSENAFLYVDQTSANEWTMTLCGSTWTDDNNGSTHTIKTKFMCPS